MKRLIIILAVALVAGILTSYIYDRFLSPELNFFQRAAAHSAQWEKDMRRLGKPCTIICGASETRMGVEPAVMLDELGLPAVNVGSAAGFGMRSNAAIATQYLRPGDTLLFSLQSISDLAVPPTSGGIKLATLDLGLRTYESGLIPLTLKNLKMTVMGDTRSLCTWLCKLATRQDSLFKYATDTIIHPSGWVEVLCREMDNAGTAVFNPAQLYPVSESVQVMQFLNDLAECSRKREVRLVIHLPVALHHPTYQAQNAYTALLLTRAGFPVLRDERLGVNPAPKDFSDMGMHLNGQATRENSRIIGQALKYNETWTEAELISLLRFMGWSENGQRLPW